MTATASSPARQVCCRRITISVLPSTIYFNTGRVGEKRLRLEKRWSAVSLSTGLQPGWGGGSGRCRLVSNGLWMACWTEALDLSGRKAQARPFFVATVGCGRRIRTVLSLLCCRQRLWQEPAGTRVRYTTILPHSSASLATTALTPVQVPNKSDGWRRCLPNRSARNNYRQRRQRASEPTPRAPVPLAAEL